MITPGITIKPNAALAYGVLDRIDANPESHNQGWWFIRQDCGTTGCFAGLTCILSGDQPDFGSDGSAGWTYTSFVRTPGGGYSDAPKHAQELLGIDEASADRLFNGGNSRADLGRLVEEIFGPRPAPSLAEEDCSYRDDPGHDHEQCLEQHAAEAVTKHSTAVTPAEDPDLPGFESAIWSCSCGDRAPRPYATPTAQRLAREHAEQMARTTRGQL